MSNIGIFIDYDNINICLEKYYELSQEKNRKDLKTSLITAIKNNFKDDKIVTIKAFADFEKITTHLTILQKQQIELRHIYSSNERKNASDIALAIDVTKSLFTNSIIDKYVIVSSDSDMLPIINEIRHSAKDVFVIYSEFSSVENYDEYANENESTSIEKLLNLNVYEKIEPSDITDDINTFMIKINAGINFIFKKHGKGTANKTNLSDYLYRNMTLTRNDSLYVVEYLLSIGLIQEVPIPNSNYKKILINETKLSEYNSSNGNTINLEEKILSESDFIKN